MSKTIARVWAVAFALVAIVGIVALVDNLRSEEEGIPAAPAASAEPRLDTNADFTDDGSETYVDVSKVIDGDTFVTTTGGKVRILGLDAPETQNGHHDCYGTEATVALANYLAQAQKIPGEVVIGLAQDPQQGDVDRYQRQLRYVMTADHQDITELMIRGGYARYYDDYPVARSNAYQQAEFGARSAQRGGWAACGW